MVRHLHVVPHTHWDREWYEPFPVFRARLVELLDEVLDRLDGSDPAHPLEHFQLDGQMAMVDDYLEVRPAERDRIRAARRSWPAVDGAVVRAPRRVPRLRRDAGAEPPAGHGPGRRARYADARRVPARHVRPHRRHAAAAHAVRHARRGGVARGAGERSQPGVRLAVPRRLGGARRVPQRWVLQRVRHAGGPRRARRPRRAVRGVPGVTGRRPGALARRDGPRGTTRAPRDDRRRPRWAWTTERRPTWSPSDRSPRRSSTSSATGSPVHDGELRSGARANLLMGVASNRVDVKVAAATAERSLERLAEPLDALWQHDDRWAPLLCDRVARGDPQRGARLHLCLQSRRGRGRGAAPLRRGHTHRERGRRASARPRCARASRHPGPTSSTRPSTPGTSSSPSPSMRRRSTRRRCRSSPANPTARCCTEAVLARRRCCSHGSCCSNGPPCARPASSPSRAPMTTTCASSCTKAFDPTSSRAASLPRTHSARSGAAATTTPRSWCPPCCTGRGPVPTALAMSGPVAGFGWRRWSGPEPVRPVVATGDTTLANGLISVTVDPDDGTFSIGSLRGLGRLVDGGDAGDTYNWCPPQHDLLVEAPARVALHAAESGPLRGRLVIDAEYELPERVGHDEDGRTRPRGRRRPAAHHDRRAPRSGAVRPGHRRAEPPRPRPPAAGPPAAPPSGGHLDRRVRLRTGAASVVGRGWTQRMGCGDVPVAAIRARRWADGDPRGALRVRAGRPGRRGGGSHRPPPGSWR